ncbi:MAG: carboxypeptidase-like regulatory domain-containing protein [Candidatus Sulfopaludibacter sp.]|nr:carboxypeptidase-like regulatory domain-containing protein [Candidatus Sulfopaludibacter sp.]
MFGQTVSSQLQGTVTDPANAVVPGATVTATSDDTGTTRTVATDTLGVFRFLDLAPGTYSVSVHATGFKGFTQNGIVLVANETRQIGKLELSIGNTSETVTVTAEAASIQLASSEKAEAIEGSQLSNVTLRGRDIFGYMKLIPGVIDNSYNGTNAGNRDVTSPNAIRGITINGNTSALNFAVDGITDMDTGSNSTLHYEPNADAVQEMKVLTSNYQAEFGRNSGGTITVVTKNGTQQFHGSMVWNHRNEGFDANQWENNRNGRNAQNVPNSPIAKYRFNVETYTFGGPIYIPKHFNTAKNKLFFFWSQEYTGQYVGGGSQTKYTPTALERQGNFSQSFQNNGSLVPIIDPTTGAAFPGNIIPANRITPLGQSMLNFFPLPNIVGTGSQANIVNYFESASASHPRRNDVLRVDVNPTSKLTGYFRYINDHDDMTSLYQGVQFSHDVGGLLGQAGIAPIDHPNPGHGFSGTVTYSISPTLINEFTVGESWNTWSYYTTDGGKSQDRSLLPNPPVLFPIPTTNPTGASATNGYFNVLPQFQFGGVSGGSSMNFTRNGTSAGNYENFNTIWTVTDNISKIVGRHTFKAGVYIEKNNKIQPSTPAYAGSFNFSPDTLNALGNTTNGYANALLGYVDSYSQTTARAVFNTQYWNAEFYIQDNWKVTSRLTLDLGLRFYHQTPQVDLNDTFSNFFPSQYSASAAPRVYIPGTSSGKRVAIDPGTGTVAPVAYIGLYVPNSGNPANGMALLGVNGTPNTTYNQSALALAPRLGFAYDLTGDGKTALRGGFGIYYNRLDGNQVYALSGQAPYSYSPQVNYTTFSQIATSGNNLVFGPSTINSWPTAQVPWDRAQNASINIQRSITRSMVLDVGYSGDWGYNQQLSYDINPIPIGTRAPFNPKNADPTNGNKTLPDILLRTKYPGFNVLNTYNHLGSSNYNALTSSLQERLSSGLVFGAAYTWSRAMGLGSFNPVVPNNAAYNYGRQGFDRRQNFQFNWSYDLPDLGKKMHSKILGAVVDYWTLSGIWSIQSGPPFNPGFSIVGGTPDYTGTPDVGARINVIGNPYANVPAGYNFNPAAFAPPAVGTNITTPVLGNLGGGAGVMSLPHYTNVDATMSKFIPLFGERRGLRLQAQAYNVFNHPEYIGVGNGMLYTAGGAQTSLTAGVFNSTLPARIMAFSARFEF